MHQASLRPLRTGDLLDMAFRLYRAHFLALISVAAVALVPLAILQALLASSPAQQVLSFVQSIFLLPLITSALIAATIATYQREPWTLASAYKQGRQRYGSVLAASIRMALVFAGPILIGVIIGIGGAFLLPSVAQSILLLVLVVALLPIFLFFYTKYTLAFPAILAEHVGAGTSMSRSWQLTTGHFWHAAGVLLATSFLTILIGLLPTFFVGYLAGILRSSTWLPSASILITQASLVLTLPFQYLVVTCLYYDLRVRSEGYDLELAAQAYGSAPAQSDIAM